MNINLKQIHQDFQKYAPCFNSGALKVDQRWILAKWICNILYRTAIINSESNLFTKYLFDILFLLSILWLNLYSLYRFEAQF